jgi:6-phosphogluconolactonase (cycloisomerase 2 family)
MPYALYVCLQDDNKIAVFAMDPETGELSLRAELPIVALSSASARADFHRLLHSN